MSDKEEDKKQMDPEEDEGEDEEEDEEEGSEEEEEGDSDSEFDDPPGYVDDIPDEGGSLTLGHTQKQWLCHKVLGRLIVVHA